MNYKEFFVSWFNTFITSPWLLNQHLHTTVEDSPYHREENVLVHTQMVIEEYMKLQPNEWTPQDVFGAICLAFHDVGKPEAKEIVTRDDGTTYNRFGGHEKVSANLWRDYITQFHAEFEPLFDTININNMFYDVAWMIEHHLPYSVRDKEKINNLVLTLETCGLRDTFFNVLRADARGRISDDHPTKLQKVEEWITNFPYTTRRNNYSSKQLVVLIGPSGSGKSTYTTNLSERSAVFSYDQLRLDWYYDDSIVNPIDQYKHCFDVSINDNKFNEKAFVEFRKLLMDENVDTLFIDNTNMSTKSRRQFIVAARQKGYCITAVIFVVSKETINNRQDSRTDKYLPRNVIESQFYNMSVPSYGEVDIIDVVFCE